MASKRILVVGSTLMTLSLNMYEIPSVGQSAVDDGGVAYTPCGAGIASAVAFSRLGADAVLLSKLGRDAHGQRLYEYLRTSGVNTSVVKVDPDNPTGFSVVMRESATQSQRSVVYPGANGFITTDNILEGLKCEPDAVYISFDLPFPIALSAAKIAASRGIPVFIDASPASPEHQLSALPRVTVFTLNDEETLKYTGYKPMGFESSLRAALALSKMVNAEYIVIKLGARGSFVYDGKRSYMVAPKSAGKAVDTAGVGDAYTAALTLEYLRCGDIKAAMEYGSAAAAISVTRSGASASVPTEAEVQTLINQGNGGII